MSNQTSTSRYWIFKDFPENVWFKEYPSQKTNGWVVRPDTNIKAGDVAYLWREDQSYFLGWAEISSDPAEQDQNPFTGETVESHWMVEFTYHRFDRLLSSAYLRDEPALERIIGLSAIPQNVIEITLHEAVAFNNLIRARSFGTAPPPDPPEIKEPEQKTAGPVDPDSPGTMSLEQLFEEYSRPERRLSKLCMSILQRAKVLAGQRDESLRTSHVLFAAIELGAGPVEPQNETAPQFLRRWIDDFNPGDYARVLKKYFQPLSSGAGSTKPTVDQHAIQLLEIAWKIADFVRKEEITFYRKGPGSSERGKIYGRDLLGALLYQAARGESGGAARRLQDMKVPLYKLREDFFKSFLSSALNPDDDIDKWRSVLIDLEEVAGEPQPIRKRKTSLPSIDADTPSLKDHLNIASEVKGFANIIAARDVKTPLSIGLFGDWGSGKSTFMEQLQAAVEEISAGVRAKKDDEETSFYGNIVQIKFNAWHYAEANLWASLVSHVFENLSFSEREAKEKAEKRKQLILGQLVTNLATQRVAEAEVKTKEANYESAKTALDDAQRKVDDARVELRDVLLEGIWSNVTKLLGEEKTPDVQRQLDQARELLGRAGATEEELKREIDASRSTMGRLQLRLASLAADPGLAWKLALLLALTILVPVALSFIVAQLSNTELLERIVAGVTPLITVIGGAIAWWQSKRKSVATMLDTLDDAGKQLDQMYARAKGKYESDRDRLSREVEARKREIEKAKQKVEKASQERTETLAALREMEPAQQLEAFVQERAASDDYRKLLGVVALIRRDFKRLSDMLREQDNDELRQAVTKILQDDARQSAEALGTASTAQNGSQAAGTTDNNKKRVGEVTESDVNERMKEYRVDRIVLYIDDLDRCPPKQVVDVLQAIHLLLAFELFVVVVGVDARWIGHALRKQFPEMLNEDWEERHTNANSDRQLTKTATPRDYVEKIFQVPFWLRPLDDNGSRKLLEGLIPDSQLLPVIGTGHVATVNNKTENDGRPDPEPLPKESVSRPSTTTETDTNILLEESAQEGKPSDSHASTKASDRKVEAVAHQPKPELVLKPESLLLDVKEREAMIALSRVIGRTPRTLKRFVNIYRIIKAGLSDQQLDAFIGTSPSDAQYRAVLLLLSVAHGAPDLAPAFFRQLMRSDLRTSDGQPIGGLKAFLTEISTPPGPGYKSLPESWYELMKELKPVVGNDKDDIPLSVLRDWLPVVVRYTFQLGRLSEEVDPETAARAGREE